MDGLCVLSHNGQSRVEVSQTARREGATARHKLDECLCVCVCVCVCVLCCVVLCCVCVCVCCVVLCCVVLCVCVCKNRKYVKL